MTTPFQLEPSYCYILTPGRVIDGDTFQATLDLGCYVSIEVTVRVYGINAPELHGPTKAAGESARQALQLWLNTRTNFVAATFKPDRQSFDAFRRYLGMIAGTNSQGQQEWLHEWMINNGHAVHYMDKGFLADLDRRSKPR